MQHLLTVDSAEFDGASWRTWIPAEDRPEQGTVFDLPFDEGRRLQFPAGLMLGDMGGLYVFTCGGCPDTPFAHRHDCS